MNNYGMYSTTGTALAGVSTEGTEKIVEACKVGLPDFYIRYDSRKTYLARAVNVRLNRERKDVVNRERKDVVIYIEEKNWKAKSIPAEITEADIYQFYQNSEKVISENGYTINTALPVSLMDNTSIGTFGTQVRQKQILEHTAGSLLCGKKIVCTTKVPEIAYSYIISVLKFYNAYLKYGFTISIGGLILNECDINILPSYKKADIDLQNGVINSLTADSTYTFAGIYAAVKDRLASAESKSALPHLVIKEMKEKIVKPSAAKNTATQNKRTITRKKQTRVKKPKSGGKKISSDTKKISPSAETEWKAFLTFLDSQSVKYTAEEAALIPASKDETPASDSPAPSEDKLIKSKGKNTGFKEVLRKVPLVLRKILRILGKILLILLIIAVIYLAGVITGILISQTPVIQNLTQFIP